MSEGNHTAKNTQHHSIRNCCNTIQTDLKFSHCEAMPYIKYKGPHPLIINYDNEASLAQWRVQTYGTFFHYMNHCRRPMQFPEFNYLVINFQPDPSAIPRTRLTTMKPFSAFTIDRFQPHPSMVPLPLQMLKWHQC